MSFMLNFLMVKKVEEKDEVIIKFAGDSGDGMQLTGTQFSNTSAFIGNGVRRTDKLHGLLTVSTNSFQYLDVSSRIRRNGAIPAILNPVIEPTSVEMLPALHDGGKVSPVVAWDWVR